MEEERKKPTAREKFRAFIVREKKQLQETRRHLSDVFDRYATAEGRRGNAILRELQKREPVELRIVQLMEEGPFNPNIRDDKGSTLLHLAIHQGLDDVAMRLLDRNADPNAKEYVLGQTPLMVTETLRVASKLVEKGARIDERDNGNWTALIWYACFGRTALAGFALDKGADPEAVNDQGQDAMFFVKQRNYEGIGALVQAAIGKKEKILSALQDKTPAAARLIFCAVRAQQY